MIITNFIQFLTTAFSTRTGGSVRRKRGGKQSEILAAAREMTATAERRTIY